MAEYVIVDEDVLVFGADFEPEGGDAVVVGAGEEDGAEEVRVLGEVAEEGPEILEDLV